MACAVAMYGHSDRWTVQVEAYLRFNDISYTRHTTTFGQTPKGRLPYIKHGDDQVSTDDSSSALCLQFSDAVMKSDAAMDMSSGHDPAGWRQPIHHQVS